VALVRVRLAPGTAPESKRVVHLVNMPTFNDAVEAMQDEMVSTLCGTTLALPQVDVIMGMAGMPCFICLQNTPSDGEEVPEQRQIANGRQRMGDQGTFRMSGAIP
jgi:hypothetical protein